MKIGKAYVIDQPYQIVDIETGFLRGSMFSNLYSFYKYESKQKNFFSSNREKLMYMIMCYNFGVDDIQLYLNSHPHNQEALRDLQNFKRESNKLVALYEKNYGPLTESYDGYSEKNCWVESPWPWEGM